MGGKSTRLGGWRGRIAGLQGLAFALLLGLSGAPGEAGAGQGYALIGGGGGMGGVMGGALGGEDDGLHGYAGVIYAPAHMLSDSGLLLRGWAKSFGFSYLADLPGAPDTRIEALGYGGQVEAGWQIAGPRWRVALVPGIAWRDYSLKPSDPGSDLDGDRFGISLAADGEWRFGERFGIMANGSYVTVFEDYWVQSRPFVHLGHGWKMGLDFAGWGGPDYGRMRAGLFTSGYELPVRAFGRRMFLGADAGVESDQDGKRVAPFGGINIGLLF